MYKVLIAEDELFVRLGIKNCVDWTAYGMQVVCDVDNGLTAWEKIQEYAPDILITDIRMPGMDGTQLIRKMRDSAMEIYTVVITCLEEFSLVKDLMSLGVRDYLLKATMTEEEIGQSLGRAFDFLEKENRRSVRASEEAFVSKSEQCNRALQAYLNGSATEQETAALLEEHHIRLGNTPLILALCPVEKVSGDQGEPAGKGSNFSQQTLFDLLLRKSYSGVEHYAFLMDNQCFLLLVRCPLGSGEKSCRALAGAVFCSMQEELQDYLNLRISFLTQFAEAGFSDLKEGYTRCLTALDRHYLDGMGTILLWNEPQEPRTEAICRELLVHREWIGRSFGVVAAQQYVQMVEQLPGDAGKSQEEMLYALMKISHFAVSLVRGGLENESRQCDKRLLKYPFLPEGTEAVGALLEECSQYYIRSQKGRTRREIQNALEIIREALPNPELSLGFVADRVGLSEPYFSTLFRQELEQPFVKYLTKARVERAKRLLEETALKIFDVAMQSGFADEAYFSRVFKKETGMSPTEWRAL